MTGKKVITAALFFTVFLSGCISFGEHYKGLEPNARVMESDDYEVLGTAEGQSSSFRLIGLFPVTPITSFDKAIDEAISDKGGDNLINVKYSIKKDYWVVGMIEVLHVKGVVIRYRR